MSQSTPLNQLPNQQPTNQGNSDDDLVNDILNEMDAGEQAPNDMNASMMNYANDPVQIPPEKMDTTNFLNSSETPSDSQGQEPPQETQKKKSMRWIKLNLKTGGIMSKCVNRLKLTDTFVLA